MRIENDVKLDYTDVLICPQKSTLRSRKDVDLEREFEFLHTKSIWKGIPIVAANMDGVGTVSMANSLKKHKLLTALHKFHSLEECARADREHAFVTIGIREKDFEFLKEYKKKFGDPKLLCIDVANGYIEAFIEFIKLVRNIAPQSIIMAGNVVTKDEAKEIIRVGADIAKIGIGPGTVCTTRVMTGVGYPQLSAVMECAEAVHKLGGFICADGGCRNPGDVAKAFGAGADFVMNGGLFAGHDESEQELIEKDGGKFIIHHGSSSREAMEARGIGKASYKASEGKQIFVPYKGAVDKTVEEILGGLRSTCTYVGAAKLEELPERTTFIRVNRQLSPSA